MASTKDRLDALAKEHLGLDRKLDFDTMLIHSDVSSVDAVAFVSVVNREFGVRFLPEVVADIKTLNGLAEHIDAHTGYKRPAAAAAVKERRRRR